MTGVTNIPDVAKIVVSAPANTTIVMSLGGVQIVSGTTGQDNTCSLTVRKTGEYAVNATFDGTTTPTTIPISRLGKKYFLIFTYMSNINVTTYPGAAISATRTGQTALSAIADQNGSCTLVVPAGGRGDWVVSSEYHGFTASKTVSVTHYNDDFDTLVHLSIPIFTFTPSGGSAIIIDESTTTSGSTANNGNYYYYRDGNDWEFYAKVSGSLSIPDYTCSDIFLCGAGSGGGSGDYSTNDRYYESTGQHVYWCSGCWGGGGGSGGSRKTIRGSNLKGTIDITCGSGESTLGSSYTSSGGTRSGAGQDGGYCFDDSAAKSPDGAGHRVGAGGGNGAASLRSGESVPTVAGGSGGSYGGGDGGGAYSGGGGAYAHDGDPGSFFGAGGGGGAAWGNSNESTSSSGRGGRGSGGSGFRGFVAFRSAR